MKKQMFLVLALASVIAASVSVLTGCGSTSTQIQPPPPPTVTITGATTQQIGVPSYQYSCAVSSGGGCTWESSDAAVMSIDATTGAATPSATQTGDTVVTITATSAADASAKATKQITVGNWLICGKTQYGGNPPLILLVDIDSKASTAVNGTDGMPLNGTNPWFFADHQLLVFTPNIATSYDQLEIVATDGTLDGKPFTPITLTFPNLGTVDLATPSPDGKSLLFIAKDPTTTLQGVYVADIATGTPQLLYQQRAMSSIAMSRAMWSPDGTQVVYNDTVGGHSDIWTLTKTFQGGSNQTEVTFTGSTGNPDGAANATFSADGTMIYYSLSPPNSTSGQINLISANNTVETNLGTFVVEGDSPVLSPNKQFFVINGDGGVETYNLASGETTLIIEGAGDPSI